MVPSNLMAWNVPRGTSAMVNQEVYIKVKDHSVSGEEFELRYNETYDMLETFPQPAANDLQKYYQSEDYISHTDSKRNLFERVYHLARSFALKRKLNRAFCSEYVKEIYENFRSTEQARRPSITYMGVLT